MDFRLTSQQEKLRQEFNEFFSRVMKEAPLYCEPGVWAWYTDEVYPFHRKVARMLGEKGWLSLPWPREYGGQEHTQIEQMLFNEVRGYWGAPGVDNFGVGMIAPTLLQYGTEEQKREFLPPIARGEVMWCQGWSEPNAGSDLASLATTAIEDGDDYIINGQKIWNSGAHRVEWMFMVARTDPNLPRHRGISYFLVDMKAPGVTVHGLRDMGGFHMFNEVFFDKVRVPKRNMVGEKNRGWYVTLATMNFERSGVWKFAEIRHAIEELVHYCKETGGSGGTLAENPRVRHQLAQLLMETEAGRSLAYRIAWLQWKGQLPAAEASASKVYGTELAQRVAYAGCSIMGLYGQLKRGSRYAPIWGKFERLYQSCLGYNIAAGTSEIQRNIIAIRGLNLPRS